MSPNHLLRLVLLVLSSQLGACAVYMASNKEGANIKDVLKCQTRTCLVARGAEPLPAMHFDERNVAAFRVRKATGSALRAIGWVAADVVTFGIAEAIATPVEGMLDKTHYYGLKVSFAADGETIMRMQVAK